ncbi:MAG: MvdC/MvdD family ATP grasp protein, partial [Pseudonocardiaceae bacterium]
MTEGSIEAREAVLVVTAPDDSTADAVEIELKKRSVSVLRIDTGDFPTRIRMAVRNDSTRWRGHLLVGSDVVDLDSVRSVYYRRPSRFVLPPGLSAGDAAFATTEARLGFGGPFSSLPVLWVNHPAKVAMAEYKSVQLTTAAAVGLSVPRTLITNDIEALRAFAAELKGPVVCKTFSSLMLSDGEVVESVFTTIVDPSTIDPRQFAATAHLIQEWIPKAFDTRVTVVGSNAFATAIYACSDRAHVDWRADYQALRYERIDPPLDVVEGARRYLSAFGLNYGAFDFVVEPSGAWRFLEFTDRSETCTWRSSWRVTEASRDRLPARFGTFVLFGCRDGV